MAERPCAVLDDIPPEAVSKPPGLVPGGMPPRPARGGKGLIGPFFGRG